MSTDTKFDIEVFLAFMGAIEYGVVHWFNSERGFGFIRPDGDGPDIYLPLSEVAGNGSQAPNEGQRVSYLVGGTHLPTAGQSRPPL